MKELIFLIEDSDEGGYVARALGHSIFTESDTIQGIQEQVKDAVRCHFDPENGPKVIRLHFVRDKVINP